MFENWIEKMCVNFYFYMLDNTFKNFNKITNQCILKDFFSNFMLLFSFINWNSQKNVTEKYKLVL
jgi:hypothetical protein